MEKNYPEYRKHLQALIQRGTLPRTCAAKSPRKEHGTMKGFGLLHQESMKAGALGEKHKELMALGIGIASRCDGCIAFHTHEALAAGATAEEIHETIGVAISMGGGPALMYAAHALEALEQFQP